jgi:superfamily II DNA/RNA helicase
VSQISHVINYDVPDTTDAYTHRIGRTGRAARTGDAFTLITDEDADTVRAIERVLGAKVPRRTLPGFDYTAPAPARDTEFARPPREPQRRRPAAAAPPPEKQTRPPRQEKPAPAAEPTPLRPEPARPPRPRRSGPAPETISGPAPAGRRSRPRRRPRNLREAAA